MVSAWSIPQGKRRKSKREQSYKKLIPGPGQYQQNNDIGKHSPKYSISGRYSAKDMSNLVGPGQYNPQNKKSNSPAYSISKGKSISYNDQKPGPGAYDSQLQKVKNQVSKQISFGKQKRQFYVDSSIPGPGQYQPKSQRKAPSYHMGIRPKDQCKFQVPGPGNYQYKGSVFSRVGGFISKINRSQVYQNNIPGPGSYKYDIDKAKQRAPSVKFTSGRKQTNAIESPGPGSYSSRQYKSKIGAIIGKQKRNAYNINQGIPGPGQYQSQKFYQKSLQGRKAVIGKSKRQDIGQSFSPGPGQYQPKYDIVMNKEGNVKFTQGKAYQLNQQIPGPGTYENNNKLSRNGVSFARQNRFKHQKDQKPGPGHYDNKPAFADVPKYLLPNGPQKSKHYI